MATAAPTTYNSISGVDIKAVFGSKVATPLQAVSYAIQREKAPIYTMGNPNPRAFSRGKRGIAGTLIFAMFTDHPLLGNDGIFIGDGVDKFWADEEEGVPSQTRTGTAAGGDVANTLSVSPAGILAANQNVGQEGTALNDQVKRSPWYVDQILPFDITLVGSNEYGAQTQMAILGV